MCKMLHTILTHMDILDIYRKEGAMEILNSVVLFITLIVLIKQICNQKKVERANLLLNLRNIFNSNEKKVIHMKLRPAGEWASNNSGPSTIEEWVEVDDYLGYFELLQLYLDKKVLKNSDINNFYKYRLNNLLNNELIVNKIKKEKVYWHEFIRLSKTVSNYNF